MKKTIVFLLAFFLSSAAFALPSGCKLALEKFVPALPEPLADLSGRQIKQIDARKIRLAQIQERLEEVFGDGTLSTAQILDEIAKDDVRGLVFQAEAILRLYDESDLIGANLNRRDQYSLVKLIHKTLQTVTDLENNAGFYTDAIQWNEWIITLRSQYGEQLVPMEISQYFEENLKTATATFKKFLRDNGWLGGKNPRPLKMLDGSFRVLDAISAKKDRKLFVNGVADYLEATGHRNFNMLDLNNGVHPFRRHLRWFSLMVQASNLFMLDSGLNPIPQFKNIKIDPALLKYAQVNVVGHEDNPIHLSRPLFYEVVQLIGIFGHVKDIGQFEEVLAQAYQTVYKGKDLGQPGEAVRRSEVLASYVPDYVNPWTTAATNYELARKTKLLEELRQEVLSGLK